MPVIKSAKKRMKTNAKANLRNVAEMSATKSTVKAFLAAKKNGSKNVKGAFNDALSAIDRAKSKGLIKANTASRKKSHLTKLFNK